MKKTKMIETYLDGSMDISERKKIEVLLSEDKKFYDELEIHRDINESISDDEVFEFRKIVASVINNNNKGRKKDDQKSKIIKYIKYPVAASILLLIGLSLIQIFSLKSSNDLYLKYYKPYQTDIATRSLKVSSDKIQLSYLLYQEGNYETSFELLRNYIEKKFNNQTARFYYGMNAIELEKYDLAISELIIVEQDPSSPFSLHARWYLAMMYLKTEQTNEAKKYLAILSGEESMYSERARMILKKLKP
ncbi:hypothetical protein ES705_03304 [subsurface metagenome]